MIANVFESVFSSFLMPLQGWKLRKLLWAVRAWEMFNSPMDIIIVPFHTWSCSKLFAACFTFVSHFFSMDIFYMTIESTHMIKCFFTYATFVVAQFLLFFRRWRWGTYFALCWHLVVGLLLLEESEVNKRSCVNRHYDYGSYQIQFRPYVLFRVM